MMPLKKVLAGALCAAAVIGSTPAAAQYYPRANTPYPYGNGGVPTMGNAPAYGYGYGGYDGNQGPMVSQCTAAVQARLDGGGGYGGYGAPPANRGGRVLGISHVEPRDDGGFTVRGVAASGGYGYDNQQPDLIFRCRTDFRGTVTDVTLQPAQRTYNAYGSAQRQPYGYASPYNQDPYGQGYGQRYAQGPYNSGPYAQNPYDQGADDQGPYDQGSYYQSPNDQAPDNTGPYGYTRY